ncbi:hypothetical protein AB0C93_16225 [Streptomyces sp. NPDC048518]|uniref:hypothetical protein n=1 Tax=Streptomyces sp. NPDC048518 TaxID=3155029 RepID=UPI0033ED16FC
METWREDALPGHTHDPNEVTVQIDGLGRQLAELPAEPGREGAADGPVFVDETGRRGRRYRRIGMIVGVACAGYAAVIVATLFSGNSSAPWVPMPDPKDDKPASKVDTPHRPTDAVGPSASSSSSTASPSSDATDGPGATRAPGEDGEPDPARRDDDAPSGTGPDAGPSSGGRTADSGPDTHQGGTDPAPTGGTAGPGPAPDPDPAGPAGPPTGPATHPADPGADGGGSGGSAGEVPVVYTPPADRSGTDMKPSSEDAQR